MSDLTPLITLGHTLGIERAPGEADSDLALRILTEVARLRESERSARRNRRLAWALRAAVAAAGIVFAGL